MSFGLVCKSAFLSITASLIAVLSSAQSLELDDNFSYVTELRLNNITLTDALYIYHSESYTLLPFNELLNLLNYPIEVTIEDGDATGWFISEEQTFGLNISRNELYFSGERKDLPKDFQWGSDDFDLYIDAAHIEEWFGFNISFDMGRMSVVIATEIPQPIEIQLKRERVRSKINNGKSVERNYPEIEDNYQWYTTPIIEGKLSVTNTHDSGGVGIFVRSVGDVLKHQGNLSINYSDISKDPLVNITLRKDFNPTDSKKTFLPLRNYEIGNVFLSPNPLVTNSLAGIGAKIQLGNEVYGSKRFSGKTIQGQSIPGWDVELYHNSQLVDYQTIPENGIYLFEEVDVNFGENVFEIVSFGPQGQKRSKIERLHIGANQIIPKTANVQLGYVQSSNEINTKELFESSIQYGVSTNQSINLNLSMVSDSETEDWRPFGSMGWTSSIIGASFNANATHGFVDGKTTLEISGVSVVKNQNIQFQNSTFIGENDKQGIINELALTSRGNFSLGSIQNIGHHSEFVTQVYRNDDPTIFSFAERLSINLGRVRLINKTDLSYNSDDGLTRAYSKLSTKFNHQNIQATFGAQYDATTSSISSMGATGRYRSHRWTYKANVSNEFSDSHLTRFGVGVSTKIKKGNASIDIEADTEGRYSISGGLEFGINVLPTNPYISLTNYGSTNSGRAIIHSYIDNDYNSVFSEGDEPLPGIKIKGRSAWSELETDENGFSYLSGLNTNRPTTINIDGITLPNPFVRPLYPYLSVYSHPGGISYINFPILETTDIEGYVKLSGTGSNTVGAGGVELGLYSDGQLIKKTSTEFDGYYYFEAVFSGTYTIDLVDKSKYQAKYNWQAIENIEANIQEGITYPEDLLINTK